MTSEIVTLAASVVALLGSVLSLFISSRLALTKERRQLLWSKELDRVFDLEELAGYLLEEIGSYRPIPNESEELIDNLESLHRAAGRFARYPDVRQALRDLHGKLTRMYVVKRDSEDDREIRPELEPAYRKLLEACDAAVSREKHT